MRRLRPSHPGLEFSGVGAGQVLSRPIAHPKATTKAKARRPASIKTRRTTRFTAQLEQAGVHGASGSPRAGSCRPEASQVLLYAGGSAGVPVGPLEPHGEGHPVLLSGTGRLGEHNPGGSGGSGPPSNRVQR
jgi:hypothetical protein